MLKPRLIFNKNKPYWQSLTKIRCGANNLDDLNDILIIVKLNRLYSPLGCNRVAQFLNLAVFKPSCF